MFFQQNPDIKTNDFPGVTSETQAVDNNPTLASPYSPYELPFEQTRETLMNTDSYREFLNNAISRFRRCRTYSNYKGFLIGLGMDRCQVHGNITNEMATIEMHHNLLTVFDIAMIISEHTINTRGKISSFDLVKQLKKVHKEHKVQLVMLSLTPHQLYHNANGLHIHPDQTIGDWWSFLEEYHTGITIEIGNKVLYYINTAITNGCTVDDGLLNMREQIKNWSDANV